jgi:hypothetical protein
MLVSHEMEQAYLQRVPVLDGRQPMCEERVFEQVGLSSPTHTQACESY